MEDLPSTHITEGENYLKNPTNSKLINNVLKYKYKIFPQTANITWTSAVYLWNIKVKTKPRNLKS